METIEALLSQIFNAQPGSKLDRFQSWENSISKVVEELKLR